MWDFLGLVDILWYLYGHYSLYLDGDFPQELDWLQICVIYIPLHYFLDNLLHFHDLLDDPGDWYNFLHNLLNLYNTGHLYNFLYYLFHYEWCRNELISHSLNWYHFLSYHFLGILLLDQVYLWLLYLCDTIFV